MRTDFDSRGKRITQMIPLNDLSREAGPESDSVIRVLEKVIRSGSYTLGDEVRAFEEEFSTYLGVAHTTAVASGTDALVIALRSVGVGRNSKVLVVANAGGYTTTALLEIGATPVFVDCDDMGRMSLESLEEHLKLEPAIDCVVSTHLYGLDSNIIQTKLLCDTLGVALVEDCAQSSGAKVQGKSLGSFGDVATFSFYPTKNLGALGDGGAVVTNSPELASAHMSLRQYGWLSRYHVGLPFGKNSRLDELQAAFLRLRLPMLDELNLRRKSIWSSYSRAIENSEWRLIGSDSDAFVAHLGILICPLGQRESAASRLKERGVSTSVHYPILDYRQKGWRDLLAGHCPTAEDLATRILTIPLFPGLTTHEFNHVSESLRELVGATN